LLSLYLFGASATPSSVVIIRPAIEATSCSAMRTTLVGSMMQLSLGYAHNGRIHIVIEQSGAYRRFGLRPSQLNIARTRNEEENRTEEGSCKAGQGQRQALSGALR
jgi:hypothetical protein